MSLLGRIPAESALAGVAHRALMLAWSARVARRRGRSARALARALRSTGLGRFPPEERAWIARIEARRGRVASQGASAYLPAPVPGADPIPDQAAEYLASSSEPWSLPALWGGLIVRLVRELAPRSCLELGTGYGISALYAGAALRLNGVGAMTSVDSEPRLIRVATQGLSELGLDTVVRVSPGEIAQALDPVLAAVAPIDWALIDAEHNEPATVGHFESLLGGLAEGAVVLIDDIDLSAEMNRAWQRIKDQERVDLAVDLQRLGVVLISGH